MALLIEIVSAIIKFKVTYGPNNLGNYYILTLYILILEKVTFVDISRFYRDI